MVDQVDMLKGKEYDWSIELNLSEPKHNSFWHHNVCFIHLARATPGNNSKLGQLYFMCSIE